MESKSSCIDFCAGELGVVFRVERCSRGVFLGLVDTVLELNRIFAAFIE